MFVQFSWAPRGALDGVDPLPAGGGVTFWPESATSFVRYDLETGTTRRVRFKAVKSGTRLVGGNGHAPVVAVRRAP